MKLITLLESRESYIGINTNEMILLYTLYLYLWLHLIKNRYDIIALQF